MRGDEFAEGVARARRDFDADEAERRRVLGPSVADLMRNPNLVAERLDGLKVRAKAGNLFGPPDLPLLSEVMAAAAEAARLRDEWFGGDRLVNGAFLVTPAQLEQIKAAYGLNDAAPPPEIVQMRGPSIPVVTIPDDGQPHDVGDGKVAIVSPIDHTTIYVVPTEVFDILRRPTRGDL